MEKNKNGNVKPIPEGFHSVTPYLVMNNASMFLEFVKDAFDGKVTFILKGDDAKIIHAMVQIGDSIIMLSDAMENMPPVTAMLYLYVDDVDAVFKKALKAKGKSIREPLTEFYGDRSGCIEDGWDNKWWIATHVEDVSEEELSKRAEEFYKQEHN